MLRTFGRKAWFVWQTSRFFSRMLIEYVATVWLLGIAPFLARLAVASSGHGYDWIPADLYLFVMIIGGNMAIEAFKDRRSDGPSRPITAMSGVGAAAASAWAFASLEAGTTPFDFLLRSIIYRVVVTALGIDLIRNVPAMIRNAHLEATTKGRRRS
jgi:hypothetical protein